MPTEYEQARLATLRRMAERGCGITEIRRAAKAMDAASRERMEARKRGLTTMVPQGKMGAR